MTGMYEFDMASVYYHKNHEVFRYVLFQINVETTFFLAATGWDTLQAPNSRHVLGELCVY